MNRRVIATLAVAACMALGLSLGVTACASTSGGDSGDRDLITADQLAELQNMTAYDAIRRLKPTWLRKRGTDSFRGVPGLVVMVNEVRQGGVSVLNSYQIRDVEQIRYLDPRSATMKYGTQASGGAIELDVGAE